MFNSRDIQAIEQIIDCQLPRAIIAEAMNPNSPFWGERDDFRFAFISVEEHRQLKAFAEDRRISPLPQLPELKPVICDAEGRFISVFASGPMLGRLALVTHDSSIDCAPLYRSLSNFIKAIKAGVQTPDAEWPFQVDYPNTGYELQVDAPDNDIEDDIVCATHLERLAVSACDRFRSRFLRSCIVSLTPRKRAGLLLPMLNSSDYHACGRASIMLGYYQFEAACDKLARLAMDVDNAARFAAVDGLGLMRTLTSRKALIELVRSGVRLPGNITTALRRSGFGLQTRSDAAGGDATFSWYVDPSGDNKWELLNIDDKDRPVYWWNRGI